MRNRRIAVAGLALISTMLSIALPARAGLAPQKPTIVGTWLGKTEVPDQGTDEVTLVITRDGESYAVTMTDSLAMVAKDSVKDVTFVDNQLSFFFALTDGAQMKASLTFADGKLSGQWFHPEGSAGALTFERKPEK